MRSTGADGQGTGAWRAAFVAVCLAWAAAFILAGCATEMAGPDAVGTAVQGRAAQQGRTTYPPSGKANFSSPDGAFEVWFPGRPKAEEKDDEDVRCMFYSLEQGGRKYFAGVVSHDHASMSGLALRRAVRSTEERLEGRITKEEPIWFKGHEGREFILREPAGTRTLARYYSLGPRLYMARFTAGDQGFPMAEAKEFLDSFNILADPEAGLPGGAPKPATAPAPASGYGAGGNGSRGP